MYTYDSHIKPFSKQFKRIRVSKQKISKIEDLVQRIVEEKQKESHHQIDYKSTYKRFYTGLLGEAALEEYLGVEGIIDWSVGASAAYHQPDLKSIGLKVGVKTVEYGLFPVVFKKSYSPQIINISWKKEYVYICGLATPEILQQYQSIDLIKDTRLRARGTKTGFYGFEYLKSFDSIEDLKHLIEKKQ
jgi:hypothetical protein